jgi:hypothetical protein
VTVAAGIGAQWPSLPVPASAKSEWAHVHELAVGVNAVGGGTILSSDVIYADGTRHEHVAQHNVSTGGNPPPADLASRHVRWDEASFPSFEAPTTADAIADCGATGDGQTSPGC